MSWPTPQDFQEAMQNPRITLADPELQLGQAEPDKLGLPRPISGGFASVYKVICPSQTWGVRCFLKECLDRQQRYTEISNQLAASRFPFATHFKFLSQGIRVSGNWYPAMKMEWVHGERLDRFVGSNIQSPQKLLSLADDIVEIARALNGAGVAHGDLQHGNILVVNGKPKLIDYDGMYVPALRGWIKQEDGHPNYQLAREDSDFGPNLDNFSVWVIYLSLWALTIRPSLWTQFQGGDDCLLFRRKDFEKPAQSLILQELKRLPKAKIGQFAAFFESLFALGPLQIPLIDPDSPPPSPQRIPGADWLRPASPGPPQPLASAFSLSKQWAQIDQIPRPKDILPTFHVSQGGQVYSISQAPGAEPIPWPLPTPVPAEPPAAKFQQSVVPVGSLQESIGDIGKILGSLLGLAVCVWDGIWSAGHYVFGVMGVETRFPPFFIVKGALLVLLLFPTLWGILELIRRIKQRWLNREFKRNVSILPYKQEATRRREAVSTAKSNVHRAEQQWKAASEAAIRQFEKKKAELKKDFVGVEIQREAELKQMLARARESQLSAYLSQHLVQEAAIDSIGEKLKKNLSDMGIRTALDVGPIGWPRGFGDARKKLLVEWRRNVEATFVFKTGNAIPPGEMQALESKYQHLRQQIQERLNAGEKELKKISQVAENQLGRFGHQIKACMAQLYQAEADLTVIPKGL